MLNGYHASGEQFSPSQLLDCVQAAECAGLQAIMTSDHLAPWSERQGNSGNNCAWLGAAMAKTTLPSVASQYQEGGVTTPSYSRIS